LKGLRAHFGWERRLTPREFGATALLCLALLALLATVQVAHIHPLNTDADHCPLCVVMHTAAPVDVTAAVIVLVLFGTSTPLARTRAVVRLRRSKLFTRPPPAGC
jgi:hypothetical protein